ncbi:MAG: TIGR03936 family radical SAM-associated protein, partial [Cyanobium sp. ELA507]
PWDHIDSGVDKRWLAEDLQRALAAAVVPDCSFAGCSSCGVCGPELGHNVVIPPPPVPAALPRRAPPSERVARLRFGFAKGGTLALISHLDTLRMLERALRRSGLPVSFTGGFHPLPRLQLALSLPLGVEGEGEWLDLEFTQPIDPETARAALAAVLPPEFRLLSVAAVPVASASLSQELAVAEWRFTLRPQPAGAALALADWQRAIDGLLAAPLLPWRDTDKKGRPRERDCRPDLLKLRIVSLPTDELGGAIRLDLEAAIDLQGRSLRPVQLGHWLGAALGRDLAAEAVVRRALRLRPC